MPAAVGGEKLPIPLNTRLPAPVKVRLPTVNEHPGPDGPGPTKFGRVSGLAAHGAALTGTGAAAQAASRATRIVKTTLDLIEWPPRLCSICAPHHMDASLRGSCQPLGPPGGG